MGTKVEVLPAHEAIAVAETVGREQRDAELRLALEQIRKSKHIPNIEIETLRESRVEAVAALDRELQTSASSSPEHLRRRTWIGAALTALGELRALERVVGEANRERIVEAINHAFDASTPVVQLHEVQFLWERCGPSGRRTVAERSKWRTDAAQTYVAWQQNGWTLETVLADLARMGLILPVAPDLIEQTRSAPGTKGKPDFELLWYVLAAAKQLATFHSEFAFPPRFERLFGWLAEITGGRCVPQHVWQSPKEPGNPEAGFTIGFVYEGRGFRFDARDFGDHYDVESVENALHFALCTTGRRERFLHFFPGPYDLQCMFVDPEIALAFVEKYSFKLSLNREQAEALGPTLVEYLDRRQARRS